MKLENPKEAEALINKVVDDNKFQSTWLLGGICKAVYVTLRTIFYSTEDKAKFVSHMLNSDSLSPQSLCWFSTEIIKKIRPAHPLDLAKGAASTSSTAKKAAFGQAYHQCFEVRAKLEKTP